MRLEDFDYDLPPELVAQYPPPQRADARMLVVHRSNGTFEDGDFQRLPEYLNPGDLLVVNNSRVLPARLFGHRLGLRSQPIGKRNPGRGQYLTSAIEVLLTRQLDERTWEALVRPGRKVRVGERLVFSRTAGDQECLSGRVGGSDSESPRAGVPIASRFDPGGRDRDRRGGDVKEAAPVAVAKETGRVAEMESDSLHRCDTLEAEVIGRGEFGIRILRFPEGISVPEMLERVGHVPLPPYIHRLEEELDRQRYQTVYASRPGSVAAPTAGLHFTEQMLSALECAGIERVEITLHVGLGTFQPIHTAQIEQHHLHSESFQVTPEAAARLNQTLAEKRRIVAVGTTTVRTLEHLAALHGGRIEPGSGETQLFIWPGYQFRVVGGLLTNFHLPRTTLLMLVAAFAGRELILAAYEHAVRERYRFYSYGDCTLIL